ncbi:MAG: DsbA family protein, partial [Methanobacteriota archaeon]
MEDAQASAWALSYSKREAEALRPAPAGKLRVELVTDPWSVWCWGFEPVRRALEHRHPAIEFRPLVGGMFPRLPDPREVGFNIERFFANVQRTTGMPMRLDAAQRDRPESTYPACVFVHAARLLAPSREAAFLRGLREAAYLDAANVSRNEVAADVAHRVGLSKEEFLEALESGEPEREFAERLQFLQGLGIFGYPTLLLTWGRRTARVEGFQSLPSLLAIAESMAERLFPAEPPPSIEAILRPGERVATREVAEVLGVGIEEAYEALCELEREGKALWRRGP